MTKDEWLNACAAHYATRAAIPQPVALQLAGQAFTIACSFEGNEAAALLADPVSYADAHMDCWES